MATAKKPKKKKELDLSRVLSAVDTKNYEFYDNLSTVELKEFSPYILLRFVSNVNSDDSDLQEWFIERTNELVNKNYFSLGKDNEKLLWQLYAATGTGYKTYHPYLPALKKEFNKIEKLLAELHPSYKIEDVKLLARLMTDDEKDELLDDMGFDKKQRKEYE
jgi:hypothetical protein